MTSIDYSAFDFSASIDWIEVRVTLHSPSQPRHVRARINERLPHWNNPPYLHPETENRHRTSRTFVFRVQNPVGPDQLMRDLQALGRDVDPAITEEAVDVLGLEVSVDATSRCQDRSALIDLAHHLFRYTARPPSGVARVTESRRYRSAAHVRTNLQGLAEGLTINSGAVDSDYRSRDYVKTTDTGADGAYQPLPSDRHSARTERVLTGAMVPFTTIDGWRLFEFGRLANYFTLRRDTEPRTTLAGVLQAAQARRGRAAERSQRAAHKRTHIVNTKADIVGYEVIRNALRRLTRAQQGKATRKPAKRQRSDVANSGTR
jgi:hypothetical protein